MQNGIQCFPPAVFFSQSFSEVQKSVVMEKLDFPYSLNEHRGILVYKKLHELTREHEAWYDQVVRDIDSFPRSLRRVVRSSSMFNPSEMHLKTTKLKKRECVDVSGVMGGSNAFNFLNFVAGILTLVVNVNNSINSNNNNLNGIALNTNSQSNSNMDANNNAVNKIMVMPGR